MSTRLKTLSCLLVATLLWGCTAAPAPPQEAPRRASAVSVSLPGFVITADTTLAWRSSLIWVDDPEGRFERRADSLQRALQQEFERKGFRFVDQPGEADYAVTALAMLGTISGHPEVEEVFRLYPALEAPSRQYRQGSVLVAIAPAGTGDIVWRGALEVFTEPGMQEVSLQQERMTWAARQLLASIPASR